MKAKVLLFSHLASLVLVSGCSGLFSDMGDGDSMLPVYSLEELLEDSYFKTFGDELAPLIDPILSEHGACQWEDFAMVVNDKTQLKEIIVAGETMTWPIIDFERYSLVVGKFFTVSYGYKLANQYVTKGMFRTILHLEVEDAGTAHRAYTKDNYFAAIYPKLPDGQLTIKRENNVGLAQR